MAGPWTESEIDVLCTNYESEGLKSTCKLLPGRTYKAVAQKAISLGVRNKQRWLDPDEGVQNRRLKHRYGIDVKSYNRLFSKQQGCCAICGVHQSELSERLCIDHNHETGKVRGLLCRSCNRGIGFLKDDFEITDKATTYLKGGD